MDRRMRLRRVSHLRHEMPGRDHSQVQQTVVGEVEAQAQPDRAEALDLTQLATSAIRLVPLLGGCGTPRQLLPAIAASIAIRASATQDDLT
jgi:hypothetical protein